MSDIDELRLELTRIATPPPPRKDSVLGRLVDDPAFKAGFYEAKSSALIAFAERLIDEIAYLQGEMENRIND